MAAAQSESSSVGARLKSAREGAGLTVIQAAERLHVDPHLVEALEGDRFEELGASVYARGHIRRYAELVGESSSELRELYSTSAHAAHRIDLTRVPKGQDSAGASSALLVPAVLVVAFVAVIGTVWWVAGTLNASRLSHRGTAPARQSARAVPSVDGREAAAGPAVTAPDGAAPSATAVAPAPAAALTAGLPPGQRPPGEGTLPESTHSRPAVPAKATALRMHFAEDSWAEVYDARGERLFYDIGSADSTRTVSGMPPLKVVLGNPVGVSLELDGRPVSVPDGAQRNVTLEFRITRSGHSAPAHLAAAGEHASTASVQAP
ncbi:MAG TPA: RodZ domain-containing protein [Steroidobacteraceae bacterium]